MKGKGRGGPPLLLSAILQKVSPSKELQEQGFVTAFQWWERCVPRRVHNNARPVRIHKHTLIVHTSNPTWSQELTLLKQKLLEAIRAFAPHLAVRDIRFQTGKLPDLNATDRTEVPLRQVIPLSALPESLAKALVQLRSDDLRIAIQKAASITLGTGAPDSRGNLK